jgi:sirohydrochlorin cobaltochelatase
MQGLLLFGHGARDAAWADPFRAVADCVRAQRPQVPVELAFLELMQPALPEAAAALVARGCRQVSVVPLFLGTGGHVRRDLPRLVDELRARHPEVLWSLRAAVGEHPAVIEAMAGVACDSLSWTADRT